MACKNIEDTIMKFLLGDNIRYHNYLEDENVLGCFFYGSYQTGYNTEKSDLDLHIIYSDSDKHHFVRGNDKVDGIRVEYFEKPLQDIYDSINNEFISQDNATYPIIGTSRIIFDKTGDLKKLQEYAVKKFSQPLPPLSLEEAREQVSILNNRMEKVTTAYEKDDPYFYHLYHVTIEKIRKFYHRLNGMPAIPTSKVIRIYDDESYRTSIHKERIPEPEFIQMYKDAIFDTSLDKSVKFEKIQDLYNFAKRNVPLDEKYRILIKSRNNK